MQPKGIDLDAAGNINGLPVIEVDLDSFEDKPWRKPGGASQFLVVNIFCSFSCLSLISHVTSVRVLLPGNREVRTMHIAQSLVPV